MRFLYAYIMRHNSILYILSDFSERDAFDAELTELKKKLAYLETTLDGTTHERDELRIEVRHVI